MTKKKFKCPGNIAPFTLGCPSEEHASNLNQKTLRQKCPQPGESENELVHISVEGCSKQFPNVFHENDYICEFKVSMKLNKFETINIINAREKKLIEQFVKLITKKSK